MKECEKNTCNCKGSYSRSDILNSVVDRFESREKKGLVTYGKTMDRNDLSILEWAQHLQEELMDAVLYIEKFKQEIHYTEEVDPNQRINIPHLEFRDVDQLEYLHNLARAQDECCETREVYPGGAWITTCTCNDRKL